MNAKISQHPLILHKLTQLRDESTPTPVFRRLVRELSQLLFVEASGDLSLRTVRVKTPLVECEAQTLETRLALIPILRAGLGMAEAILDLVPEASTWHLGLYRDHDTLKPKTYYNKLTESIRESTCYVVDPMLATGGSAVAAIDLLKQKGATKIRFLALIAAPEGVEQLQFQHPDVAIHLAVLDDHLNDVGYIVPGLGDAGDRQFGT